jgi:predicted methyltransferase MtxX (methanogen marker protein 4)
MNIKQKITERVELYKTLGKPKLAFGMLKYDEEVIESLRRALEFSEIIIVGKEVPGFTCIVCDDPLQKCIELIKKEEIDALIRGNLPASISIEAFAKQYGKKKKDTQCISMQKVNDQYFFFGPGTNYAVSKQEKQEALDAMIKWAQEEYGLAKPKIGIMSGCRPPSYGKDPYLDKTHDDADEMVAELKEKGYDAKNYYIEIETALKEDCEIILATDGRIGNAIFRIMSLIGFDGLVTCRLFGLPFIFTTGSRNTKDYFSIAQEAAACVNYRKSKTDKSD